MSIDPTQLTEVKSSKSDVVSVNGHDGKSMQTSTALATASLVIIAGAEPGKVEPLRESLYSIPIGVIGAKEMLAAAATGALSEASGIGEKSSGGPSIDIKNIPGKSGPGHGRTH